MVDIVISEFMDPSVLKRLEAEYEIAYDQDLWKKPDQLAKLLPGVPGLITRNQTQVRGAVLDAGDALKCVGRLGVGLDNIDTDACASRGIDVFPATGANSDSVAELAIGGLFVMFRGAYYATDETLAGGWPRMRMMGREVAGKRLGIIGFGSIGKALAWRAKGVGLEVAAYDPYVDASDPRWLKYGVDRRESLGALVADADAVSVHVPLNVETRSMIDADVIAQMKSDAVLFNLARGGIVNERDLAAALTAKTIAGAFLDTFDVEPLTLENVFAGVPNLMVTPHVGARTVEADDRVCNMIADAVMARLKA